MMINNNKIMKRILMFLVKNRIIQVQYLVPRFFYETRVLIFLKNLKGKSVHSWWFGLVSLFNGISTVFRLFNAKAILLEEQWRYYLTHSWEDKGVHTFPKGICPKVNVIARLEHELAYYDSAVHRFNHYTTRTPPCAQLSNLYSKWLI